MPSLKIITEGSSKSGSVGSSTGDRMTFPNIYFGDVEASSVDWRKQLPEEVDPDDEDGKTPDGLIEMTGIDPDELFGKVEENRAIYNEYNTCRNQKTSCVINHEF